MQSLIVILFVLLLAAVIDDGIQSKKVIDLEMKLRGDKFEGK